MANLRWLLRRLRAMSLPEVAWRVSQKNIQKSEKKIFYSPKVSVTDHIFNGDLRKVQIDSSRMSLNFDNDVYSLSDSVPLLGGYDYSGYKKRWRAGFQTINDWPLEFSYSLEYKQRDDIGDARTNWELNRHFQFALLAKNYCASKDKKYLKELIDLFEDWNNKNPFLWGISWTSVMEVAIRCSNWCYAYCFLDGMPGTEDILIELRTGIINMTEYITKHYSRYSSANNHLIVEAYAIGQAGILTGYNPWTDLAIRILSREFPLQNYSDGVNKELSLHYQSFYMEAIGLMMRLMIKNNIDVPDDWYSWLGRMSKYLRDCIGKYGEVVEFGDNDEGKILDLSGTGFNHYQYVLQLMGCMLEKRYSKDVGNIENIRWLFTPDDIALAGSKELYSPKGSVCYREGGNTILRSKDERILIGIDHAALGFGSIAAHGHADALSFQMFVDGEPVFVDPGTYIYHCDLESRNAFRKTINHNTVCVDGKDQSEMLGAFLWGKKAECSLLEYSNQDSVLCRAQVTNFNNIVHDRTYQYDSNNSLSLTDTINCCCNSETSFILSPMCKIVSNSSENVIVSFRNKNIEITFNSEDKKIEIDEIKCSTTYGQLTTTHRIRVRFKKQLVTNIRW